MFCEFVILNSTCALPKLLDTKLNLHSVIRDLDSIELVLGRGILCRERDGNSGNERGTKLEQSVGIGLRAWRNPLW